MDRDYIQLNDGYVTSDVLPAAEYNCLVGILDRQVHGALQGVGDGLIVGGGVADGGGFAVSVSALQAILDSSQGYIFLQTNAAGTLTDLPASSTIYIHAGASITGGADDSQVTAAVTLFWSYSNSETDAVLLAKVVTDGAGVDTITDERSWVTGEQALQATAALDALVLTAQGAIGTDYFGAVPPASSLDTRVAVLEGAAGGPAGTVFWGVMYKGAADATTIGAQIASDIAQHETDFHGGGGGGGSLPGTTIQVQEWDVEAGNHARFMLKVVRSVDPDAAKYLRDCVVVCHGVFGDGSGDYNWVDQDNTTWTFVGP